MPRCPHLRVGELSVNEVAVPAHDRVDALAPRESHEMIVIAIASGRQRIRRVCDDRGVPADAVDELSRGQVREVGRELGTVQHTLELVE